MYFSDPRLHYVQSPLAGGGMSLPYMVYEIIHKSISR